LIEEIARQLIASFSRIAAADGSRIELLVVEETRITVGMHPGTADPCESGTCILPQAELQQMMAEWLSRRAPDASVSVKLLTEEACQERMG
jgi:hypothetical protein